MNKGLGNPGISVITPEAEKKDTKSINEGLGRPRDSSLCSPALAGSARTSLQLCPPTCTYSKSPRSQGEKLSEFQGISAPWLLQHPGKSTILPTAGWRGKELHLAHKHHCDCAGTQTGPLVSCEPGAQEVWWHPTRIISPFCLLNLQPVFGCFGWSTVQRARWGFDCFMNRII